MDVINLLFSFSGRIGRLRYFFTSLIVGIVASIVLSMTMVSLDPTSKFVVPGPGSSLISILSLIIQASLLTKRIRDTGSSLALVWIFYICLLLSFPLLLMIFVSPVYAIASLVLSLVSVGIGLYALFKRGTPDYAPTPGQFGGSPSTGFGDEMRALTSEEADANAIIARALAAREPSQAKPVAQAVQAVVRSRPASGGGGQRQRPAFGQR